MNQTYKGTITLIRSGITGEKLELPVDFDLESAHGDFVRHQIIPLVYEGAVNCGISKDNPVMGKMFAEYCRIIISSENQRKAIDKLLSEFEDNHVDYMPLKGCNLKLIYPKPEMRCMGDADILVRREQFDIIDPIMRKLGYQEKLESDHDKTWIRPELYLELHKCFFEPEDATIYNYFGTGWEKAWLNSENQYCLSKEDEYIYLFAHIVKHFRNGGIGLRHMTDLWVFKRTYTDMDWEYIFGEFQKLHFWEFYKNVQNTLDVWFEDANPNEMSEFITEVIFKNGSWGDLLSSTVASVVKQSSGTKTLLGARIKKASRLVFLPYRYMKQKYKILNSLPILLPVFWIVRIVTVVVTQSQKTMRYGKVFLNTDNEYLVKFRETLEYVGLDYDF